MAISISHTNHLQTNSIYNAPFKRTSGTFGSRLWSDLPLPIDECSDSDVDFRQLPEMRRKYNENDKVHRTHSLQPNLSLRVKQPLSRHISSPMRFGATSSTTNETDRNSDASLASKMSFRNFFRRMSSKRRNPTTESSQVDTHFDKSKSHRAISIRFEHRTRLTIMMFTFLFINRIISEREEVVNNSGERDEHAEVVKCSEEVEDDEDSSIRKLI